ncbi:MAG: MBL fold metallo-hydrolase [Peptococcaceae bacterium]|nr:MBL fold metallo-hydrolase [Peptococcaceae bacterium]
MNRRRLLLGLLALVLVMFLVACQSRAIPQPILTAHFIDVGQGDSILLQAGKMNVLIDAGEREMGERVVAYLRAEGVKSIDLLIATHPHADHIGGLAAVMASFPVRRIIDSGQVHTSQTFLNYLRLVDDKKIPFETPNAQVVELAAGVTLRVIGPRQAYDGLNDGSVVALVTAEQVSLLLTGDMEERAERDLVAAGGIAAQILKVGHHGSSTSSTRGFLQMVRPQVAIISVGQGNPYGHPAEPVLARLRESGADIYRTDVHGTVVLRTDGAKFSIKTQRRTR